MSYSQEKNPLSRKVSPLNANNPFKRISPLNMAEKGVKHKDMSKDDKKKHRKAKHSKGGDPDMERERREEEMSRSSNEPLGPERKSSDPNGNKLASYKDIPAEEIPGYDDGAGGFDYENYDRANSAPGAQYTDEAAEAAFKKMKYTTDAAIRAGAGVDLGTIKKSPLNKKNIKAKTGFRNISASDKRANEVRELSVNKAMRGKRTMKNRHLKPAGKVAVETAKEGLAEGMQSMVEKAKPVNVPKPKPRKTPEESVETRARRSVKAPSKDSAKKMSISRKNYKYKK